MVHRATDAMRHEAENVVNSRTLIYRIQRKPAGSGPRACFTRGQERYCSFSLPDMTSK
jgi:hypothetical protein